MLQLRNNNKGSLLVELLIATGIIVGSLGVVLGLAVFSLTNSSRVQHTAQAVTLAEETLEALRNYRDGVPWQDNLAGIQYDGLETLVTAGSCPCHLVKSADTPPRWQVASGAETIEIFTRQVELAFLERDANDNIVASGTPDEDSVMATITVSWEERGTTEQIQIVQYLTNWQQL